MGAVVQRYVTHLTRELIYTSRTFLVTSTNLSSCVSASPSTSARPVSRSVTPAGSCTVLNMAYSRTDRCPQTGPSEAVMTPSTLSSARPVLASTCQGLCLLISSLPSLMRSVLAPTDSCSTPSSSSLARRMLPTTTPVVTTPSVRRSSTWCSTASVSWLISARVSRASSSSTRSVEVPAPGSLPSSWRGSALTTARSPSSSLPSTLLLRFPLLWLSPTTPS